MIFDPTQSSKNIVDFYRGYLLTTFTTNNRKYNEQLAIELEKPKAIADGPYISMTDPYKKGASIADLVEEGILSPLMLKMKSLCPERPLYLHQEEAVRAAVKGENVIVTTGTGSGKTESFLIPIINELLREKEQNKLGPGVRTLIIYPMNALVNDQIQRIRKLLSDYKECGITFGKFTGETKDSYSEALAKYEEIGDTPLEGCEIICRKQMRETPPNILITNYAMLEYMLLRPGDNVIFCDENAEKWKHIIFDEAHSYTGAKGIEVGTLVKRVKAMLERPDIRFILTSATLGDENSNDDIVRFGECLCDAEFKPSNIIRSHTVTAAANRGAISIPKGFYQGYSKLIREDADDDERFEYIRNSAIPFNGSNVASAMFDIVLHDSFYCTFRNSLLNKVKSVRDLAAELCISETELNDFIASASSAHQNGEKLFEAKYHMFIRGMEGVYVTLKPTEKLFIHRMENYVSPEDGLEYKVFSTSFCSNCGALFLVAEIEHSHLVQHARYENESVANVFLLSDEEFEEDDIPDASEDEEAEASDDEKKEEKDSENTFYICSRCGEIKHTVENLKCGHGAAYATKLRRVKKKGQKINKCPCCHSMDSHRSIIRPYFLGAEAATSVIATALYREIPGKKVEKGKTVIKQGLWGKKMNHQTQDKVVELSKQFLAFSDSRQAAAFFAAYLQNTYNTTMVKRIMTDIITNCKDEYLTMSRFASLLCDRLKQYKIEKITSSYETDSWVYILKELSNFKAKNSLASLGILHFDLPINLPEIEEFGMNAEEVNTLFHILFREIAKEAAVNIKAELSEDDWKQISPSGFRRLYDEGKSSSKLIIPWLPNPGKQNKRLKQVMKFLRIEEDAARELLSNIWMFITSDEDDEDPAHLKKTEYSKVRGYALDADKFRVTKAPALYCCSECRKITPYNFRNMCENPSCNGILEPYDPEIVKQNHHYRKIYSGLEIYPMRVVEHTAQLSTDKASEYQKDFIKKKINVLSCSTTFEMGVDVGSLETVFMRNMPPTPANYAQRAGRAGRSFYSAAYALTYCPNNSHDLNYYKDPVKMIQGTIRPPYFNMDNNKIVLRHMISSALACFWRRNSNLYFGYIGEFVKADGFDKFREYLNSKPNELRMYLEEIVPDDLKDMYDIENFGWIKYLFSENGVKDSDALCDIAVTRYKSDLENLRNEKNEKIENEEKSDYLLTSINTLEKQRTIDFLSRNNIIPKYGFPVDTVELQPPLNSSYSLRLSRDLFTAISEYAPGSQVVANGSLITSRYIKRLRGYEWPVYKYVECSNCKTINTGRNLEVVQLERCIQCGEELPMTSKKEYLIPKFGFISEKKSERVGTNKPERTYHGMISYVGDEKHIIYRKLLVNGYPLRVGNSRLDSLIVLNESNFFVCKQCGYTEIQPQNFRGYHKSEDKHRMPSGAKCENQELYKFSLGHEFKTDVIAVKFPSYFEGRSSEVAWTILYSLLEGLSKCLNIDRNELSGCLQWYTDRDVPEGNWGYILFDNTPGGAGYVRQLEDPNIFAQMLMLGYHTVKNCECGGELKDTACYSCLCNYYNQRQHEMLKRKYAIDFYEEILNGGNTYVIEEDTFEDEIPDPFTSDEIAESNEENENPFDLPSADRIKLEIDYSVARSIDAAEVWEELLEDCPESDKAIIMNLKNADISELSDIVSTAQFSAASISDEWYPVSLVFRDKDVMLFSSDERESYELASRSDMKCFIIGSELDTETFIKAIGGKK